ncbi:MAG: SLC13 family permease [Pseudomonadota bacterium]
MPDIINTIAGNQWYIAFVMCALIGALIFNLERPPLLFALALLAIYLPGGLDTDPMLAAFVNPALITLVLLMIIASVLEKTQFIRTLAEQILRGTQRVALGQLVTLAGFVSAFANNTAVVAALIGPLRQSKKFATSKLLIPLSYASILGGMLTLIGTSTNLIVSAFMVSEGLAALSFFEFTLLGLCTFLAGGLAILTFAPVLLPENSDTHESARTEYLIEATVLPDSPLIGGTVKSNGLRNLRELFLVEVIRPWVRIAPVSPPVVIREGDVLVFSGDIKHIELLNQFEGLAIDGEQHHSVLGDQMLQTIVPHNSELVGKTMIDIDFRARFDAAVVAVCRGNARIQGGIGRLRLRTGDLLVLAPGDDFKKLTRHSRALMFVNASTPERFLTKQKSLFAVLVFLAALALNIFNVLPLIKSLTLAMAVLLISRLLTMDEIRRNLPVNLIVIVGSALGIAHAALTSGLALTIADGIIGVFAPLGHYGALIGVYLLTLLLTEAITNNASAALVCPIAYSLAAELGLPPLPFFVAVAFAASASFLSPYGYQTNLMVLSAGQYKFTDYLKIGTPVSLVYSATVLILLPVFFPFT